ncbi:MAG TPA: glycoside hydrolase domain-containing protein [Terriglobales bacterium]|nr:glycoside hydrolase domain-containing protein [Terriglobales bacterium]
MKRIALTLALVASMTVPAANSQSNPTNPSAYLGFDRNNYPGDQNLKVLRQTFSYTGYWLNAPPSARTNTWSGKRRILQSAGFGFLVLFNGRLFNELRSVSNASKLGKSDAQAAVAAARREGFPARTIIFLDQEQGGRMLAEQKAYIYSWVDGVAAGGFRAGIYCSGISAAKEGGEDIVTAGDIRQNAGARKIVFWVTNDACPPSPGCAFPKRAPSPADTAIPFADVWQFAQSPKRPEVTASCPANYNSDGNCYPPGIDIGERLHIDVNTATSADPSHGRTP